MVDSLQVHYRMQDISWNIHTVQVIIKPYKCYKIRLSLKIIVTLYRIA